MEPAARGQRQAMARPKQLSREVLSWLQGLDLAYAVKNARRDFANGFLVAEVLSRYFPDLVLMHSFDNGIAAAKRRDNWRQLLALFRKIGFVLRREHDTARAVSECEVGAATALVTQLYTFLTTRSVNSKVAPKLLQPGPRNRDRGGKPAKALAQRAAAGPRATPLAEGRPQSSTDGDEALDEPTLQKSETMLLSGDGSSSLRTPSKVLRGENRKVGPGLANVQVQAGAVSVRPFESDVFKLRLERHGSGDTPGHSASLLDDSESKLGGSDESKGQEVLDDAADDAAAGAEGAVTLWQLVQGAIVAALGDKSGFTLSTFLDELRQMGPTHESILSDQDLSRVLQHLVNDAQRVGRTALERPQQWAAVTPAVCNVLLQRKLAVAGELLVQVGQELAAQQGMLASAAFLDFCAPSLQPLLAPGGDAQLHAIATAVFLAHCPPESLWHARALERLTEALPDPRNIAVCMATAVGLMDANARPALGTRSFDLYERIALQALQHTRSATRSAGMAILAGLVEGVLRGAAPPTLEESKFEDPSTWSQAASGDDGHGHESPPAAAREESKRGEGGEDAEEEKQQRQEEDEERGVSEGKMAEASVAANQDEAMDWVAATVQRAGALRDDTWWEVRAQLAILACHVLSCRGVPVGLEADAQDLLCAVLATAGKTSSFVCVACASTAPVLKRFPELTHAVAQAFVALDDPRLRRQLLRRSDEDAFHAPARSTALDFAALAPLNASWDASTVLEQLCEPRSMFSKPLSGAHVDLLCGLLEGAEREQANDPAEFRVLAQLAYDASSTALFRALESLPGGSHAWRAALLLLTDNMSTRAAIDIYCHPLWPDVIFAVLDGAPRAATPPVAANDGEREGKAAVPAAPAEILLGEISCALRAEDKTVSASARVMLEATLEKYPKLGGRLRGLMATDAS